MVMHSNAADLEHTAKQLEQNMKKLTPAQIFHFQNMAK